MAEVHDRGQIESNAGDAETDGKADKRPESYENMRRP
jgi:hypothetical protein